MDEIVGRVIQVLALHAFVRGDLLCYTGDQIIHTLVRFVPGQDRVSVAAEDEAEGWPGGFGSSVSAWATVPRGGCGSASGPFAFPTALEGALMATQTMQWVREF